MAQISATLVKELRDQTGLGMMQCKKALSETDGDIEKAIEFLRKQGAAVAAKRSGREAKEGKVILHKTKASVAAVVVNSETDFVAASDEFNVFANSVANAVAISMPDNLDSLKDVTVNGKTYSEANTEIISKIGENISVREFVVEKTTSTDYAETYSHMGGKIGVIVKLSAEEDLNQSEQLENLAKDLAMQVAATNPISLKPEDIPQDTLDKEKSIYREQTLKEGKPENIIDKIVEGKLQRFYKDNCLTKQIFVKDSKLTVEKLVESTGKELNLNGLKISTYHRLQLGQ